MKSLAAASFGYLPNIFLPKDIKCSIYGLGVYSPQYLLLPSLRSALLSIPLKEPTF